MRNILVGDKSLDPLRDSTPTSLQ